MGDIDWGNVVIWFTVFVFSLSVHESAHAWTASFFGDDTAKQMGRISLSPETHIDPIGTILFPLINITGVAGGLLLFGWAKPVPVNPLNLRDRRKAEILISLAGPASNVVLAVLAIIPLKLIFHTQFGLAQALGQLAPAIEQMLFTGVTLNVGLAVFNMLPIPPLDGSHIVRNLLPDSLVAAYDSFAQFGFLLLYVLAYTGITGYITSPIYTLLFKVL
ncbi:MAG: site-2 protease family protein [Blastocatellia bacterium]